MKRLKNITTLFTLLLSVSVMAQVSFEAKVSKKKLGLNERLRIDFEMNQDGDNFTPPSFSDFNVIAGPNQSVSHSWVNGKRSYNKSYSYFLQPKRTGHFTIKQATITIDGDTYKTTPITVEVVAGSTIPENPNDPNYIADQNMHLVAEVSKVSPYLNEAVSVVYKLYWKDVGIGNFREVNTPRYNDFWSQNIAVKALKKEVGKYQGDEYYYVVVKKAVLYPQKTGKLEIEPLSLDLSVEVPTNRRDIFGRRLTNQIHKTVVAGARALHVKPLPENGKPADFTGAVGDFNFKVETSKTQLDASESLQATVTVSGKGNLNLFELPELSVPSDLEVFEPESKNNVRTNLSGMQGSVNNTYTIVPQYKGKYPIPKTSFSYFDVKSKTYKRIYSEEIIIDVLSGPDNTNLSPVAGTNKQQVTSGGKQFAFIKTDANLVSTEDRPFFQSKTFWTLLLSPLLFIPLAMVFKRKKDARDADVFGNKIRTADRLAKKYLSKAKKALGHKEAFYIALEKALHNYLKAKLHIETSEMDKQNIEALLLEKQVSEDTVSAFIDILKNCELARYTPITQVEMEQDYERSATAISGIDKQIKQ